MFADFLVVVGAVGLVGFLTFFLRQSERLLRRGKR